MSDNRLEFVNAKPPQTEAELEERLTSPTAETVEAARRLGGDLMILGAGGKMGPSLALLAKRSIDAAGLAHRVVCVSRFGARDVPSALEAAGVETIACDLLDEARLRELPDAPNVLYLAGMKFGTAAAPELTWALNTYLPAITADRFRRARIVALSTGNVYPALPPSSGGAREETEPAPVGEYAQSCLGRERLLTYMSRRHETPTLLVRLNYATDLRYGVLLDIAERVWRGAPVDVSVPWFNVIWQGDANAVLLRAFELTAVPSAVLNLTGPDVVSVRDVAGRFASAFELPPPTFIGVEADVALLSDASRCHELFPAARVPTERLVDWAAGWVRNGGRTLGKPTHFEARDGVF